jgi:hypothetical protein
MNHAPLGRSGHSDADSASSREAGLMDLDAGLGDCAGDSLRDVGNEVDRTDWTRWCARATAFAPVVCHRASPSAPRSAPRLLQVVLQLPAAGRMAKLAERLGLDLPDAFARHIELAPDLLERPRSTVLQPEPELQDPSLASGQ